MTEIISETTTTQESTQPANSNSSEPVVIKQTKIAATNSQTTEYLIYFLFGTLEVLLASRLILKLMGASLSSTFVSLIYSLTGIFTAPFEGIFRRGFTQGIETTSILEPSTIVAVIVYAVIALGIVKLVRIFSGEKQQSN